ncbi:MAG: cellulose biosynthesis protein BcsG [Pseudoalteromonas spongiae]
MSIAHPDKDPLRYDALGLWNLYFLVKLGLFFSDVIDLHVLENIAFIAFLLLPFKHALLIKAKHIIGAFVALFLLHYDSYLPPLSRLLESGDLLSDFSLPYLIELLSRFLSWQFVAMALVLVIVYIYLVNWVRFTTVSIAGILYIGALQFFASQESMQPAPTYVQNGAQATQQNVQSTSLNPEQAMSAFYQQQARLKTEFPTSNQGGDFDIVLLNVCSLGWDDLERVNLSKHPLFNQFDLLFDNFSSATSYSGPAGIRLLKASCGQTSHQSLYSDANKQCYLFENLKSLGFDNDFAMNHNGNFDNFLGMVESQGRVDAKLQSLQGVKIAQRSFDGTPIFDDGQVLNKWLKSRLTSNKPRAALYYNTISLHDGNVIEGRSKFGSSLKSYGTRTEILFKQFNQFFTRLEQSGRNYMVVMVPEHGASLAGDKMQIAGMRDIPSPAILDIPVGVKFIGPNAKPNSAQKVISEPSSYLAISELIARATRQNIFSGTLDLGMLAADLPKTPMVGENSGTRMQMFNGKPYIQLDDGEWMVYPGY